MFRVSKNRIRYSALSFINTRKYRKKAVTPSFNLQKNKHSERCRCYWQSGLQQAAEALAALDYL